ncbi:MAG: hypothetical protein SangKO_037730 [Sandaracinaceae bacterium]
MSRRLALLLCALPIPLITGCPRQVGMPVDGSMMSTPDAFVGDAGVGPAPDNGYRGAITFDDARLRVIDPRVLATGSSPCRAPVLGEVYAVTDGDTIRVDGVSEVFNAPVRMIGIDTPEISHDGMPAECFGNEARDFTEQLEGHLVYLTFDAECFDRFDRVLAYVHIGTGEGDMWERQMLRRGYATELGVGANRTWESSFRADEAAARAANEGLWSACR